MVSVKSLIYPKASSSYCVDTAFAVFVLFNITIAPEKKKLGNIEFRDWLFENLKGTINANISEIYTKISRRNLDGHNFYFYLVPFENLNSAQKEVLKGALQ